MTWVKIYNHGVFSIYIILFSHDMHDSYTVFGRREKEEREVEEREIGEKSYTSLVWLRWERGKRELKPVGPTIFRVFSWMRRNRRESSNICQLPILPLHCIVKDKNVNIAENGFANHVGEGY